jgi:hypothetical protein
MKILRLSLLLVLSALPGVVRATTSLSGSVRDLGTNAVTANSFVRFYLRGCAGNQPTVPGVAILVPSQGAVWFKDFAPDGSGNITGTLYSTRDAAGTGNGEIECGSSFTAVWYGMVMFQAGKTGPETPIHARNGVTLNIGTVTPITTNPVVTTPTDDGTYMRVDGGNSPATGSIGFNGGVTFSSSITAVAFNAVRFVDGIHYPYTVAGIQACSNDAKTLGNSTGICDARGVPSLTLTSELDVGDSSSSRIMLLLPVQAVWSTSITDGTSCGIKQFDKTTIVGATTSGTPGFVLQPLNSSTNVFALYCTPASPAGGGQYVNSSGAGFINSVGATLTKGAFVAQHLFDNSEFRDIFVSNTSGKGVVVADACCGTSFYNLTANGQYGAGAIPLVLGDTGIGGVLSGGVTGVSFINPSITHPGSGQNNIQVANTVFNENIQFDNLYMEPNNTDTATALVQISANAHNITFNGFNASGSWAALCTGYVVDVAAWAGPTNDVFLNGKSGCANASNIISDHVTGAQIHGTLPNYGHAPAYISGTTISVQSISEGAVCANGELAHPKMRPLR